MKLKKAFVVLMAAFLLLNFMPTTGGHTSQINCDLPFVIL